MEARQQDPSTKDASAAPGSTAVAPPAINLPKGGGALRSIGEKFAADPATGTGSMTVPIAASSGRSGFGPILTLSYDSGLGNGPFGIGWNLALPSVTRKTDKGLPQYRDAQGSDVFIISGAEDLVPAHKPDGTVYQEDRAGYRIVRYRPRIESVFMRIERWTHLASGEVHWRSISPTNVTTLYGKSAASRIADPADNSRVFSWLICESYDDKGNALVYEYAGETSDGVDGSQVNERNRTDAGRGANRYLKRIKYGNRVSWLMQPDLSAASWLFELVFDYDEDHYEELPAQPGEDQHVRACASPGRAWSARPDPFSRYRAGFEVRSYRRCRRVLMFHRFDELGNAPYLVRSTEFDYADVDYQQPVDIAGELAHKGSTRFASFIRSVTQSGYMQTQAAPVVRNGVTYLTYRKKSLPPIEFDYSQAIVREAVEDVAAESLENLPAGLGAVSYEWTDLDGEGLSGVLAEHGGAWFYKRNLSPLPEDEDDEPAARFAPLERLSKLPLTADLAGGQRLLDLAGDGQTDVVAFEAPTPGYFERLPVDDDWEPFRAFTSLPNIDWKDPNLRFVDLTGDGLADILISEHDVLTWHAALGEQGFGPAEKVRQALDEEKGPQVLFADGTQSVYLADMSGDGLTDIVRIRNGEVCYWPNLGYGRFGAKVSMDGAPWFDAPDLYDPRGIRLADIDGSGVTDILYLGRDGVRLYFNQSGNRWSSARALSIFPRIDDVSTVDVVDLLGNGTACLVWSSPLPADTRKPMRYVRLMQEKPHLLTKSVDNVGSETRIHYAPSTKFYLADKMAGRPWLTRLPFPVHVVERVETYDYISRNRFVSRYVYHHGYFDGHEREFNGFGMVEQFDTEAFGVFKADSSFPAAGNVDDAFHLPPVHTKTWLHTGAYLEGEAISKHFEDEYYREGDSSAEILGLTDAQRRAMLLPDTELPTTVLDRDGTRQPWTLSADEAREACRALKGSILRVETYAEDETDASDRPYAVSEYNYQIELLQPRGSNPYGVFLTRTKEVVDFEYERKLYDVTGTPLADPRVSHQLTLAIDGLGNVLRSAAVAYGRRHPDPDLLPADRLKQQRTHVTVTEARFTNAIDAADDYRTPLACESRTYEVLKISPVVPPAQPVAGVTNLFRPAALNAAYDAAAAQPDLPYQDWNVDENVLAAGRRRLIEHVRARYRANDLTQLLGLGVLESLALAGEGYKLAFTQTLVAQLYGNRVADATLTDEGRYVHSEGDANWWIPSGRLFYSTNTNDAAAAELAYARRHFFTPRRYRDAFHTPLNTETHVTFDAYDLLALQTEDALGNKVTAGERQQQPDGSETILPRIDYRVLQATATMDANRNRIQVVFDTLGMVAGTAIMGKPGEVKGDLLTNAFNPDLSETDIDNFFADPQGQAAALLGTATTRVIYDLQRYRKTATYPAPQPVFAATLVRETHVSDLKPDEQTRILISLDYSDGFGREIQKKVQAEPGPLVEGGPSINRRWVGSGWVVYNNKGNPVRQYEPFFDDTHRFKFDNRVGVSTVLFYDAGARLIVTLHADHSYEKVVFDPWQQATWDGNDTVQLDPRTDADIKDFVNKYFATQPANWETWRAARSGGQHGAEAQAAAAQTAAHAATPAIAYLDSLGRMFLAIADNGADANGAAQLFQTRVNYDIENNEREVIDAKDRAAMHYDYDMLNTRVRHASMEAGEHWILNDVSAKPIRAWDSRGHAFRNEYDRLRRPTNKFVRGTDANLSDPRTLNNERLVEQTTYGEGAQNDLALNLRTHVASQRDGAGLVVNEAYDFKGNLLASIRQLAQNHQALPDWSAVVALDADLYRALTNYDALNRPTSFVLPDDSVIRPRYNEANLLESLDANLRGARDNADQPVWTDFITDVDYDAKGQRTFIQYGNGAETHYRYDPDTFRLIHLYTRRGPAFTDDCENPQPPPDIIAAPAEPPPNKSCGLQNLRYTYDSVGNVTHIRDGAQQTVYFRNKRVDPNAHYTYDALYRLISAEGREHLGQAAGAPVAHSHNDRPRVGIDWAANDGNALGRYIEDYVYDAVGNILSVQHRGTDPAHAGWSRTYAYNEGSRLEPAKRGNRLSGTTVGNDPPESYVHDAHGNITRMPHFANHANPAAANMHWDYEDRLRQLDLDGGGTAYYVYDADGQRVRKVVEKGAGLVEERIYLGSFEIFRRRNGAGAVTLERETLHLTDDERRIALVETRTQGADPAPAQLIRYQLGNHLGSATLELSDQAQIISYEEYSPYGSTLYQAVRSQTETPKRFRYTNKERDEESGFYYHGARYYAPWLARWISCDPALFVDGPNLYVYSKGNPVRFVDPSGLGAEEQSLGAQLEKASKKHQDAANRLRKQKGKGGNPLKPIKVKRQKGVGGKRETIPDEVKKSPNSKKATTVVDTKGRHIDSKRNATPAQRKVDIRDNLEQVKKQVKELEAAGEVAPDAKGKALRVIHDSDKGKASTAALDTWKKEAAEVRAAWIDEATDPAEKALRQRINAVTTTRDRLGKATEAIEEAIKRNRGEGGKLAKAAAKLGKAGRHFAAAIPIAGIVLGQASAAHAASQGDYTSAALDEAGFIPVAGDLLDAFRGGMALGEVANEVLPIEEKAMEAGEAAEKAAKYLGAGEDTARIIGGVGAAVGAVGEFVAWTNPVTAPYKIVSSLF